MKEIVSQIKWVYTLYKTDNGLVLSVVCGGAGMFDVDILLTKFDEMSMSDDKNYLDKLSEKVRNNPEKYMKK